MRPPKRANTPALAAWDRAMAARAAGDLATAERWLDRASRLVPDDALVWLTLAALRGTVPEAGQASGGFVEASVGGVRGWVWSEAAPDTPLALTVRGPAGQITVIASAPQDGVLDLPPLARPRRFRLSRARLTGLGQPVTVEAFGQRLLGSPLDPSRTPTPIAIPGPPSIDLRPRPVDIVIPAYGAPELLAACLRSVLASVPADTVVHVVDDGSPVKLLLPPGVQHHVHAENRGFPAAANTGMRAAAGHDVVLLNSDTLVPPGWLARLRRAAYAAPEIGTATPLSDDDGIVHYGAPPAQADRLAQQANPAMVADIPVGVGFCLYIRRDCLDQVGPFREDLFAQGYGEENEFCLRARGAGWRHVAALDLVVAHRGGASFAAGRAALRRRNAAIIQAMYPGYARLVAAHLAADPLFPARRRMDALRWAQARRAASVVLITHGEGGGVAEMVAARATAAEAAGLRAVVLRPVPNGCAIEGYPDLRFAIPAELDALAALLRPDGVTRIEVHHLLGHHHALLGLAARLGVPIEAWVHDWAHFCPRITLVGAGDRYCGEPDVAACERCIDTLGSHLRERIGVRALRARSAAELAGSARVLVATEDGARRLRRHFPGSRPEIATWEIAPDPPLPPGEGRSEGGHGRLPLTQPSPGGRGLPLRVVVVGAIGVEKGFEVLLDCVRDARGRGPGNGIEFVVCGFTTDDERLMAAGPAYVTGPYAPAEAVRLIRAQEADLAFIPSVCPESWCLALSRIWAAGLEAVCFDLGAQAARIRGAGTGAVLPLALPASAINDQLLRLARQRRARQSSQP